MRWTPGGSSDDIEDRRDESGGGGMSFGGFGPHLGIGGTLVLLVLSFVFKQDFFALFSGGPSGPPSASVGTRSTTEPQRNAGEQNEVEFVKFGLVRGISGWL